jgi:hypothetical protein
VVTILEPRSAGYRKDDLGQPATRRRTTTPAAVPLLPSAHRHNPILKSKHFQNQVFLGFRHGLPGHRFPPAGH